MTAARINSAGSGIYTRNLVNALQTEYYEHDYRLFAFGREHSSHHRTINYRLENFLRDVVWTLLVLPMKAQHARVDVLHLPAHRAPLVCGVPMVVTFLDLAVLRHPATFNAWSRFYSRLTYPITARRASRLIAISEHTRQDLIELLGVSPSKVTVTHLGPQPGLARVDDTAAINSTLTELGVRPPFILSVGTVEPRKNLSRLLTAYHRLRVTYGIPHSLVFAGRSGWRPESVADTIEHLGLREGLHWLGYVSSATLARLYSVADLMVYPSLYEGFGLPPLEAMVCGCPVVTSNVSSLPEVVGDAALTVDPTDVQALADAMYAVLSTPSLATELRERGLGRARLFSWDRTAAETLTVYREVVSQGAAVSA